MKNYKVPPFVKSGLKILYTFAALAYFAGASFLFCGFGARLPKGTFINGEDVGNMTRTAAKLYLRSKIEERLKGERLRICAGERVYEYTFPEIYYGDNFVPVLSSVARSGNYFADVYYYLNGAEEIASGICADADRTAEEPYAVFNREGEPFTYYEGRDGKSCDKNKLLQDISRSLNGGFEKVTASVKTIARKTTLRDVEKRTERLYSFTTYFDATNADRSSNIRLAADKLNGIVLGAGEVFSFNAAVGPRTKENGFRIAKIISDGKFVSGYGGGVCQVSTTLYNAALLSGLEICEYHPHSLAVSYTDPSRDAMVSGSYCDLKFRNNRNTPIYIRAKCSSGAVCCTVYGQSDGYTYSFRSEVTGTTPRPDTVTVEGDEDKILSYGRDGTLSSGYLVREKDGVTEEKLLRSDKYLAVGEIVQVKRKD